MVTKDREGLSLEISSLSVLPEYLPADHMTPHFLDEAIRTNIHSGSHWCSLTSQLSCFLLLYYIIRLKNKKNITHCKVFQDLKPSLLCCGSELYQIPVWNTFFPYSLAIFLLEGTGYGRVQSLLWPVGTWMVQSLKLFLALLNVFCGHAGKAPNCRLLKGDCLLWSYFLSWQTWS